MATNSTALNFGGVRYAKLSSNMSLKASDGFTWMAWVKVGPEAKTPYQPLYVERQGTGTGKRFAVHAYRGRLRFELAVKDGTSDTNYDYKYTWDDRWHHIAFVARISGSSPTYEMYIDGSNVAEGNLVRPADVTEISNTAPLGGSIYLGNASFHTSGGEVFTSDRYWDGKIDEILIFSDAKNGGDILTYYTSNDIWDMTDTTMFSYWRLDEGTGEATGATTIADADNPAWTGTIYTSAGATTAAGWTIDRPFLGNGTEDTTAPTTPGLPGTPTTGKTASQFTATWTASTDNIWVQFYELQVTTLSDFSTYTSYDMARLLTKTVTNLLPNTPYYWRVRAVDAEANASGYTAQQSVTTDPGTADITPPSPPTSLSASSVSHSSFLLNFTQSASSDETGYKLDVALDANFDTYLDEYRNRDIGNITSVAVAGTKPLTTYYARLRAYDATGNDSVESATLTLQTPARPDLVPPDPVELGSPSSIAARAFTANWSPGTDNIGVVSYRIDVSTDNTFTTYLTTSTQSWFNVALGNVTSVRIENLLPETTYYYRVRALDAAGNLSPDVAPMSAVTTSAAMEEGGFLNTEMTPKADTYVNSASPTTIYSNQQFVSLVGNGTVATTIAYYVFDFSQTVGTIESAILNLYVQSASVGQLVIYATVLDPDVTIMNYNNRPATSGSSLSVSVSATGTRSIDITSLLTAGPTVYTLHLYTVSTDNIQITLSENASNPTPYVELEQNPLTATKFDTTLVEHLDGQRTNWIINPHGEFGSTIGWSTYGTGSTISSVTTPTPWKGTRLLQTVTTGAVVNQGIETAKAFTSTGVAQGQTWTFTVWARCSSGTPSMIIQLVEWTSGSGYLTETQVSIPITTSWKRFTVTRTLTNASTAIVTGLIQTTTAQAVTFYIGDALLEQSAVSGAMFDGSTSGAWWTGSTNASQSKMNNAQIKFSSTYIGDADNDNAVVPAIKRSSDLDWVSLPTMTASINRTTKRVDSTFYPSYGIYNHIYNPSAELDVTNWTAFSGAAVVRSTDDSHGSGGASFKMTTPATAMVGAFSNYTPASATQLWSARCWVRSTIAHEVGIYIQALNSASAQIGVSTMVTGVSRTISDGTWTELLVSYTTPANTTQVGLVIVSPLATAGDIYFDEVQLNQGGLIPYRDGTFVDATWDGQPHVSPTSWYLLPSTSYDVRHTYTDIDGIYDNPGMQTGTQGLTVVSQGGYDNTTTVSVINATSDSGNIYVSIPYVGDDNNNMTPRVEWKRTDLTNWAEVVASKNSTDNIVSATISDLRGGTSYSIRASFVDVDGVYGVTSGYLTTTFSTQVVSQAPAGVSRISFGGFMLMDGNNTDAKIGVITHNAFGLPDRRVQIETLPRMDGAIELQNLWGERTISMTGFVEGADRADLDDMKQALKRALAPKLQRLVLDTLSNTGRYYFATCRSLGIVEEGNNIRHLMWDAEFVCADPFAYDSEISKMPEFNAPNAAVFGVPNFGDLRVDPYFSIRTQHTSAVTFTLVNNTTSQRITPATTIISGDRLTIDSSRLSVLKNGVEIDYSGGFPSLGVGGNEFQVYLTAPSGIPSVLIEVTWQAKYL